MKSVISLPNTPSELPLHLTCSKYFNDADAPLALAQECLSRITLPDVIIGSFNTPIIWWVAAQILFPEVERLLYQDNGYWLKIIGNDIQNLQDDGGQGTVEAADSQQQKRSETVDLERDNAKPSSVVLAPQVNDTAGQKDNASLPWETYTLFAWNNPNAENLYQQNVRRAEAEIVTDPNLVKRVHTSARQGRLAATLTKSLDQKLRKGESIEEVKIWIKEISNSNPGLRVVESLERTLRKRADFKKSKKALRSQNHNFRITLPYTVIEQGLHPQSLRSLGPSERWEIYVDETGKEFTEQAKALNETDTELGRIIALAMPEGHGLLKLNNSSHATDLSYPDIQQLLNTLTRSNVGVLGATLKADLLSHSWIAAITKLVRWTLAMLPMNGRTQVVFKIENRGDYNDSVTLKALEETLVDELRQIAPERFRELQLSLELIRKDAPYNGYVDVIANCWGSPDQTKHRLLARTKWRGHCLLQSTDLAEIDRLYQESGSDMGADTWFSICDHLSNEPGNSLFHDLLAQSGVRAQNDSALWRKYLVEVQHRIASKAFDAGSLGRALTWLNQFQPPNEHLPGLLQLQLKSTQLAAGNHQGDCDIALVAETMTLARVLKDESASDACEAALRIAISATNSFDFTSVVPFIEDWVSEAVAVPGRLNHGKLLSTLGQLCAFRGERDHAIRYFDQALEHFDQLSDPGQVTSNRQQTISYRTIVQLDLNAPESEDAVWQLVNKSTGKIGTASIGQLARSGSPLRFEHYLFLRWLISQPQEIQARQDYLSRSDEWDVGEGHPWMLINAYRAWLLSDSNRQDEAVSYLQKSVDDCSDSEEGTILHWMAHCLYALGESLGIEVEPPARACPAAPFPSNQLHKLRESRIVESRIQALNTLLPFNFH